MNKEMMRDEILRPSNWEILNDELREELIKMAPDQCRDCESMEIEDEIFVNSDMTIWCDEQDDICEKSINKCSKNK